ncbi:hypothetical protein TNCV_714311 [Trichonephila clavipes]|nr:hypothetical protein TNCV_714311 [Trichonephila clavipes]
MCSFVTFMLLVLAMINTAHLRPPEPIGYFPGQYHPCLLAVRMTSHIRLDNSLKWRAVGRIEGGQSLGCEINSKQVVLSPEKSVDVTTAHQHLHKIATWL